HRTWTNVIGLVHDGLGLHTVLLYADAKGYHAAKGEYLDLDIGLDKGDSDSNSKREAAAQKIASSGATNALVAFAPETTVAEIDRTLSILDDEMRVSRSGSRYYRYTSPIFTHVTITPARTALVQLREAARIAKFGPDPLPTPAGIYIPRTRANVVI